MEKVIRTEEAELASVEGDPDYHRCLHPDIYDTKVSSIQEVEKVLRDLTFAPSCVDMNWGWQVETLFALRDEQYIPITYRLRTTFRRPDRDTKKIEEGFGRWWEVPIETTVSGVVKTAFAACKLILEHELMESFKWRNARVFDPHNTVQELAALGGNRYIDGIP